MNCGRCGGKTVYLTTEDEPICEQCAREHGYSICTELGKYVAVDDFSCDHICMDCINSKGEG